ncbi:MAG: TolC family protein [Syntrophales bacterium]
MNRMIHTLMVALLAICCLASLASAQDATLALTLKEAIRRGVEKNLDVRAELYNPAQFEAEINRNRAIYDPLFSAQTGYNGTTTSSPGTIGNGYNGTQFFQFDSSLSQLFWSGATASIGFNNAYTGNNADLASTSAIPNDYWQSSLSVIVSQPLLKNFGRENTEANINVSRLAKSASIEHFNGLLSSTIAQVRNEYFKLFSLREQLEVKKVSLELARKILMETRVKVTAGVLPAMEILNAEFGATTREKELNEAEKATSNQMDVLRLLLQIGEKGDILTVDLPRRDPFPLNEEEALKGAMSRPDIREQMRNLEISELQTRVSNNRTKPDLSLVGSASLSGLDDRYHRNLEKVGAVDTPSWGVGLLFTYPLGNNAADNDYRKSRLRGEQIKLQIKSLEERAANDVKAAIRNISTSYKQIDVADRGQAYAQERLNAYIRKNEVGLATTKDVMDVENDLVTAKDNQIQAAVDYTSAITAFWQVTGELLEREGVKVDYTLADSLYRDTAH